MFVYQWTLKDIEVLGEEKFASVVILLYLNPRVSMREHCIFFMYKCVCLFLLFFLFKNHPIKCSCRISGSWQSYKVPPTTALLPQRADSAGPDAYWFVCFPFLFDLLNYLRLDLSLFLRFLIYVASLLASASTLTEQWFSQTHAKWNSENVLRIPEKCLN